MNIIVASQLGQFALYIINGTEDICFFVQIYVRKIRLAVTLAKTVLFKCYSASPWINSESKA